MNQLTTVEGNDSHGNTIKFPTEIWITIISYLPSPFKPVDDAEHQLMDSGENFIDRVREWNGFRSLSSAIYAACKFSIDEVDLSMWFCKDMNQIDQAKKKIVIETSKKHIVYEENFETRLFPKRKELLKYDPDLMGEMMTRQERVCESFSREFVKGFSNVKKLNLDGWYFLKESELDSICENLKCLESISIVKCKRIKKLDLSKFHNLKSVRLHANQIKLRINIDQQIRNRNFKIEIVDGWNYFFKTLDNGFSELLSVCYFIKEVKQLLESRLRVPWDRIRLIFAGKELMDSRRLLDYCVCTDSTMHIIVSA